MNNPGQPTLDQLRIFLAVAEEGSFNRAAQRLGRAISAVSYGMGQLEAQLGVTLFDREGSRRPVLTREGQALLPEATSAAGAAGIKIDAPQVSKDQFVLGDADLLKLALKQALINALAVSPTQSTVMIKTAELGENIGISVIDRGPDIDPGKTPQLFELIYTGATGKDGKTVRKESIGYYLARGIVEAHGGSLWADTPPEGGLRISMMLARG